MVSMKALMSLSQYDMGVLDGIEIPAMARSQGLSSSTIAIRRLKWSV